MFKSRFWHDDLETLRGHSIKSVVGIFFKLFFGGPLPKGKSDLPEYDVGFKESQLHSARNAEQWKLTILRRAWSFIFNL
jgi:hypothetical protein